MSEDGEPMQVDGPNYHSEGHTAVQTCGWTQNALRGEGKCYKHHFYGVESHRCMQMTPVVKCNERCVFCWRDHRGHNYELGDVAWDDPSAVADATIRLQQKLLSGFGGNDDVPRERFEEAMDPRHVAISLDGEPTLYPHLPALIEEFHDRDITTFLVSNGTKPEVIADVDPTQLYISVDAPDRQTFEDTVNPVEADAWERLVQTLDVLAAKDARTVIRTTLVDGYNMHHPEWYAAMAQRADIDFFELKAYMHVGHSRQRLDRDAMPSHDAVRAFAESVRQHLPEHDVLRDSEPSRVAVLARNEDMWVEKLDRSSAFWE